MQTRSAQHVTTHHASRSMHDHANALEEDRCARWTYLKPVLLDLHPPVKRHVDLVVAEALQRNALQSIQQQRSAWGAPAPPHERDGASDAQERGATEPPIGGHGRTIARLGVSRVRTLRHVATRCDGAIAIGCEAQQRGANRPKAHAIVLAVQRQHKPGTLSAQLTSGTEYSRDVLSST